MRTNVRYAALYFLDLAGTDCVGEIDTEEKFAVAYLYSMLQQEGLVIADLGPDGPIYRLTMKGKQVLDSLKQEGTYNA